MIEINNLTVQFDDTIVLKNVSTRIESEKMTCIIGRSGAGKSVLMKTVLGLINYTEGEILIDGFSIKNSDKKIKSKMAMVFQNSALFDSFNVFQNIAFPLQEHKKMSYLEIKNKVDEMIDLVKLPYIHELYPSDLSGGMRKRVALARAIVQEPKYLIYDEPTTGLDPITGGEIINLIETIHKKIGMTSIIITHDKDCINQLAEIKLEVSNNNVYEI
ncbi:MAG: ATP-binding cassette domain-containing protein [Candidatus Cloacimonetes bacterium]|nr:ATP-binding cassette domain-containing protein [Candidatus Cloacimonadota bacterium]